ncbi:MAG: homoserine dehydrogenase [Coriobacteriia bacterium]|nr:homoserine dehydrogenase [Coriobacteriia bacterium]
MTIRVGLCGTGTVGCGCIDIIQKHHDEFQARYGIDLELTRICSREAEAAESRGLGHLFSSDFHDVINADDVDVVVELFGGTGIAKDVIMGALQNGKHVVTANKAIMASVGEEIASYAHEHGLEIGFGASVGGGIPIIGPLKHSLVANDISSIIGIVNGTTNYMLTRMEAGLSYDEALKEAQEAGFAEADPTADVDGFDAAAKIAILAAIAFNVKITIDQVHTEGIRRLSALDLATAHDMGYAVKLLAITERGNEGVVARVHPAMIPLDHQLASVNGVYNAIYVTGDFVGETMFFGEGAGSGPAASAVMGDVIELARRIEAGAPAGSGYCVPDDCPVVPISTLEMKYYLRFRVADRPGVLAKMATVFSENGVSLQSVQQMGNKQREDVNLVFITHSANEGNINAAIEEILSLGIVTGGEPSVIRVVD